MVVVCLIWWLWRGRNQWTFKDIDLNTKAQKIFIVQSSFWCNKFICESFFALVDFLSELRLGVEHFCYM